MLERFLYHLLNETTLGLWVKAFILERLRNGRPWADEELAWTYRRLEGWTR